jgi:hypothetical protein
MLVSKVGHILPIVFCLSKLIMGDFLIINIVF